MSEPSRPAEELVERIRELNSEIDTEIARHLTTLEPKASERAGLIRELRDRHGWSFRQIADAVGISHGRVQQILDPLQRKR
jgi:DNA-directed RNA polymerase specialized sigma24 family protein